MTNVYRISSLRPVHHRHPHLEHAGPAVGGHLALGVHRRHGRVTRRPRVHLAAPAGRVGQLVRGALVGVPREDRLPGLDHDRFVDFELRAAFDMRQNFELLVILCQDGSQAGLDLRKDEDEISKIGNKPEQPTHLSDANSDCPNSGRQPILSDPHDLELGTRKNQLAQDVLKMGSRDYE